jgi:hypothetical protein
VRRDKELDRPTDRSVFWFTVKPLDAEEERTDSWAFANHFVSITPLRLDLTAEKDLTRAVSLPQTPTGTRKERKARSRSGKKTQKRRLGVE